MMTDDLFLHAIHVEPEDDLPRLVYADWLLERGDPRGEFIQAQCRLARIGEDDPQRPLLLERERELLDRHAQAWLGDLRTAARQYTFRRGFLDEVAFEPRLFLDNQIPPRPPPVRRVLVDLEGFEPNPETLVVWPKAVARPCMAFPIGVRDLAYSFAILEPNDPQIRDKLTLLAEATPIVGWARRDVKGD